MAADVRDLPTSGSGKSGEKSSGKSPPAPQKKIVANPEVGVVANEEFATTQSGDDFDDDYELDGYISGKLSGWRIERNTNGFYRYRWQLKDDIGNPVTYITSSNNVGYKRGSKYLPKFKAFQELDNGKSKRKKRR